jgi:hypothetical protein
MVTGTSCVPKYQRHVDGKGKKGVLLVFNVFSTVVFHHFHVGRSCLSEKWRGSSVVRFR